jgi:hypothetical protein
MTIGDIHFRKSGSKFSEPFSAPKMQNKMGVNNCNFLLTCPSPNGLQSSTSFLDLGVSVIT